MLVFGLRVTCPYALDVPFVTTSLITVAIHVFEKSETREPRETCLKPRG